MVTRRATAGTGGLPGWLVQRATAVLILATGAAVAIRWIAHPPASHADLQAWLAPAWVRITVVLLFAGVVLHAYIGVRDVLMDYVKPRGLRLAALFLAAVALAGEFIWVVDLMARVP